MKTISLSPTRTAAPKPGKSRTEINWPKGQFTVSDVAESMKGKIKPISVRARINSGMESGFLKVAKQEGNKKYYSLKSPSAQEPVSHQKPRKLMKPRSVKSESSELIALTAGLVLSILKQVDQPTRDKVLNEIGVS